MLAKDFYVTDVIVFFLQQVFFYNSLNSSSSA